jgi:hypothetical protein
MAGCGGTSAPTAEETKPFREAIVDYLEAGHMGMKPEEFEGLEIEGQRATAKVRMATKDDLYGMKPLWTFTFAKGEGESWSVLRHEN